MEAAGIKSIRSVLGSESAVKVFPSRSSPNNVKTASETAAAVRAHLNNQKAVSSISSKSSIANLLEIARQVGEKLKSAGVDIQFRVNKDAGKVVIVVRDPKTGEVVREIPPENFTKSIELIKQAHSQINVRGLEVDQKL